MCFWQSGREPAVMLWTMVEDLMVRNQQEAAMAEGPCLANVKETEAWVIYSRKGWTLPANSWPLPGSNLQSHKWENGGRGGLKVFGDFQQKVKTGILLSLFITLLTTNRILSQEVNGMETSSSVAWVEAITFLGSLCAVKVASCVELQVNYLAPPRSINGNFY